MAALTFTTGIPDGVIDPGSAEPVRNTCPAFK
jgi:hypothetical protein